VVFFNRRHPLLQGSSGLKPSTDAAVRLAALEVVSQQTAAQLTNTARQMDKLQARVGVLHRIMFGCQGFG
jgi:hypothetical protein